MRLAANCHLLASPCNRAGTQTALLLVAVCDIALLLGGCRSQTSVAAGPPPAMPVTTATASIQPAPLDIRAVGMVEPSTHIEVKSQIAGQIMSIHFVEGQDVNEGQTLFDIDARPYRDALEQAEATVARDRAQLNQAIATVQKDIAQSKGAEADAQRFGTLGKEKLVSEQQALQYQTTADSLREAVRADQAAVESARANLRVDEAAVNRAKLDLNYCVIRAPVSGRTGSLLVHPGNVVKVDDVALVVINRIRPVFVSFNVPDKDLDAVRHYMGTRKLTVEADSRDDATVKAKGYLTLIDNTVDTQTGTVHLKARFDNANGQLWPGQFVNAVLTLDTAQNAVVIPAEAVQSGQMGQFVYAVKPDKTVEPRIVSVGRTIGRTVVINKGLSAGDTVVTDGQMMLFQGARVNIVAAPAGTASR